MKLVFKEGNAFPRHRRHPMRAISFQFVGQCHPTDSPSATGYCQCSGCPPKLDSKMLLPITPYTCVTGLGESKPVTTWKLHPYWVAFQSGKRFKALVSMHPKTLR